MKITDFNFKYFSENDVLYRGYNYSHNSIVCFRYNYENLLNSEEIDFLKKYECEDFSYKTEFWVPGRPEQIFCQILNNEYVSNSINIPNSPEYTIIVKKIWNSMWKHYYSTIDLSVYSNIVDLLLNSDNKSLSSNDRFLSYISIFENYELFDFQLEKLHWPSSSNLRLKKIVEEKKLSNNFSQICQEYKKIKDIEFDTNIIFRLSTFKDFFVYMLTEFIDRNIVVKKCANCQKYFAPLNRSDTIYCSNLSPQDNRKTCKEYGAIKTYQENLKNDEAKGLYRQIYMQKQMRSKRYPDIPSYLYDFNEFKRQAKEWKTDIKQGNVTQIDYINWLRHVKGGEKSDGDNNSTEE